MNKRHLHHAWTVLRPVKTWYLLVASAICLAFGVVALRDNYTTMTALRDQVYIADETGGDVEQALQNLRTHMGGHMNTGLDSDSGVYPPIQLKFTYERLVKAERDRANAVNSQVYTDAQNQCEALYPKSFSGGPRVPCIEQYVKNHGTTAKQIPDAVYKFSFISPRWSPDLAGWMLAFTALFFGLAVLRFVGGRILQHVSR